jgi:glycosyltransferase involved in cell wall biosynthesis
MNNQSILLSPTQDPNVKIKTKTYKKGRIIHFGSRFWGRMAQIELSVKLISWLFKNRKLYNYCLVYNFYPCEMAAAFFAKIFLRKRIIIDFEDDYMYQSSKKNYKFYFNIVKKIPDTVICINKNMTNYFPDKLTYIFNGFINLDYANSCSYKFHEGIKLLFAGTLDNIRGVDLIPDLIKALKTKIKNFEIFITGSGPFENEIRKWNYSEVTYLGFVSSDKFEKILAEADAYLVLQKPDHTFSLGSFPSKIEYYSKYKKPIFKIELINQFD